MCGICGVLSFAGAPDSGLVRRMVGRLRHRGPDGSGYYRDHRVALGHSRLAIIDSAGGAQPMCNEDGTVWITFNGEVFNYVELRDELFGLGHRFRTASDTEVVVHAWEEWGDECFARFNGQWALAIWDRARERLLLSRDRLGVRPLYYARGRSRLIFGSEITCLYADADLPRALDPVGLAETFTFWSAVAPRTVFAGIEQLEPGHCAIIDDSGLRKFAYWRPTFPAAGLEPVQDLAQNVSELRERLVEASRLRFLRSDVPVGAYLSGGIDSAVTAAVVARHTDAPLHTFSLRFADAEFDEGGYQHEMVRRLGTQHHEIVIRQTDIARIFPEVIRHAEAPVLRSGPAPMYLLSGLVQERGFKVVVTGEGADEVLAGYDIFREARVRQFWSRDPRSVRRARAAELLYPWLTRSPARTPAFARKFFGQNLDPDDLAMSHRPRWDSTRALLTMLTPEMREVTALDVGEHLVERMPAEASTWDPLARAQWLEMTTLLPGYILASQGDRMLMAHSVEGRFPFLDRDVVDLANRMPARHKLLGLNEKYVLKRAFDDLVPAGIIDRPKQPYRAPDASAFFTETPPEWLDDVISERALKESGIFAPAPVSHLFAKCRRNRGTGMSNTDNMRVLAIISTQLLHSLFLRRDGSEELDPLPAEPMTVVDLITPRAGDEKWLTPSVRRIW